MKGCPNCLTRHTEPRRCPECGYRLGLRDERHPFRNERDGRRKAWQPSCAEMLTGAMPAVESLLIACVARAQCRLVSVCAHCQSPAMRAALGQMPNISHGICERCLKREIAETRERLTERRAA